MTNTIIVPTPLAVISPEVKPTLPLQPFKRHLYTGEDNSENGGIFNVRIVGHLAENAKEEELINLHHEHLSVCVPKQQYKYIWFRFRCMNLQCIDYNEVKY